MIESDCALNALTGHAGCQIEMKELEIERCRETGLEIVLVTGHEIDPGIALEIGRETVHGIGRVTVLGIAPGIVHAREGANVRESAPEVEVEKSLAASELRNHFSIRRVKNGYHRADSLR